MSYTTSIPAAMTQKGRPVYLDANGDRDFSPQTQAVIRSIVVAVLTFVALLAAGVGTGIIPPAPWSPMGQVTQERQEAPVPDAPKLEDFDIPPGWAPAVPAEPQAPAFSSATI